MFGLGRRNQLITVAVTFLLTMLSISCVEQRRSDEHGSISAEETLAVVVDAEKSLDEINAIIAAADQSHDVYRDSWSTVSELRRMTYAIQIWNQCSPAVSEGRLSQLRQRLEKAQDRLEPLSNLSDLHSTRVAEVSDRTSRNCKTFCEGYNSCQCTFNPDCIMIPCGLFCPSIVLGQ